MNLALQFLRTSFFLALITAISCTKNKSENIIRHGRANITLLETNTLDTLSFCDCWSSKDSSVFAISSRAPFIGEVIYVVGKNNIYTATGMAYSDIAQFDGKFNFPIPLLCDSLILSFNDSVDSTHISGFISAKAEISNMSEPFSTYFKTWEISGTFECTIESATVSTNNQ